MPPAKGSKVERRNCPVCERPVCLRSSAKHPDALMRHMNPVTGYYCKGGEVDPELPTTDGGWPKRQCTVCSRWIAQTGKKGAETTLMPHNNPNGEPCFGAPRPQRSWVDVTKI